MVGCIYFTNLHILRRAEIKKLNVVTIQIGGYNKGHITIKGILVKYNFEDQNHERILHIVNFWSFWMVHFATAHNIKVENISYL
jgi:hypothetical protein